MSLVPRCVVCDAPLNPYGGAAACGGTRCAKFEATEDDRLTVSERDPMAREDAERGAREERRGRKAA